MHGDIVHSIALLGDPAESILAFAVHVGPELADLIELCLHGEAAILVLVLEALLDHAYLLVYCAILAIQLAHLLRELLATARGLLLEPQLRQIVEL